MLISTLNEEQVLEANQRRQELITGIVARLSPSQFFQTSASLTQFRQSLETNPDYSNDQLEQAFSKLVPVTKYSDYEPYIQRFFATPDKGPIITKTTTTTAVSTTPNPSNPASATRVTTIKTVTTTSRSKEAEKPAVKDLLGPGLPQFLIHSSSTSGGKPKHFPYYITGLENQMRMPLPSVKGKILNINSLAIREVLEIDGHGVEVCIGTTAVYRTMLAAEGIVGDDAIAVSVDAHGIPQAIRLIKDYTTFLTIFGMFAVAERDLVAVNTTFGTLCVDWIQTIAGRWDEIVYCIESGELPKGCLFGVGLEGAVKIRFAIGDTAEFKNGFMGSSEGALMAVNMQDPNDPDLVHIVDMVLLEFMKDKQVFDKTELIIGEKYQMIVTNLVPGLWRYNLEDAFLHMGYHPHTKQPVMRYVGRDMSFRLTVSLVCEPELRMAATEVLFNKETKAEFQGEFVTFFDNSRGIETVGYCVEALEGATVQSFDYRKLEEVLTEVLCRENECLRLDYANSRMGRCVLRVLKQGTFSEFRAWRTQLTNSSAGQVKVPVVVTNEEVKNWFLKRALTRVETSDHVV
ncbi:UNVERIFIED_CONTAM: hypothetical protein HDU68_010137 [Siphonaria sp. JEL0065]|nr:hypothetical protein HDU68_010137 [Siphonaria sp. JEL0065]